jgi:small subunit ribosomal protein S20
MATHKSALKRHRQSLKRRERNRARHSAIRTALKGTQAAVQEGNKPLALQLLHHAESIISKAVLKGALHKKNARRHISRLAKAVAKGSK